MRLTIETTRGQTSIEVVAYSTWRRWTKWEVRGSFPRYQERWCRLGRLYVRQQRPAREIPS